MGCTGTLVVTGQARPTLPAPPKPFVTQASLIACDPIEREHSPPAYRCRALCVGTPQPPLVLGISRLLYTKHHTAR